MYNRLRAWWLRNFVFHDYELFDIKFLDGQLGLPYQPKLFEVLYAGEGTYYIYLGNNKFVTSKRRI